MDVCGSIIEEKKQFQVKLTGEEQKANELYFLNYYITIIQGKCGKFAIWKKG